MRIVCDTNVLVSGFAGANGPPARILLRVETGRDVLFCTIDMIQEFAGVMARPPLAGRLRNREMSLTSVVRWLVAHCLVVEPFPLGSVVVVQDPSDDAVLACAATVRPDFIVSGDRHLLQLQSFEGIPIVKPVHYLSHAKEGESNEPT